MPNIIGVSKWYDVFFGRSVIRLYLTERNLGH